MLKIAKPTDLDSTPDQIWQRAVLEQWCYLLRIELDGSSPVERLELVNIDWQRLQDELRLDDLELCLSPTAWVVLEVEIRTNPDPAVPVEAIGLTFTVTNSSGSIRMGVTMQIDYPVGLKSLSESAVAGRRNNCCGRREYRWYNLRPWMCPTC